MESVAEPHTQIIDTPLKALPTKMIGLILAPPDQREIILKELRELLDV